MNLRQEIAKIQRMNKSELMSYETSILNELSDVKKQREKDEADNKKSMTYCVSGKISESRMKMFNTFIQENHLNQIKAEINKRKMMLMSPEEKKQRDAKINKLKMEINAVLN